MKIKKSVVAKMVKKAYKEGRQWVRGYRGRTYAIMIDLSDAEIWTDVFLDENSWREYNSETIERVLPDGGYYTVAEAEEGYMSCAIDMLMGAGWEIEG